MKSLKKKFGKFAISEKKAKKVNGGIRDIDLNPIDCSFIDCTLNGFYTHDSPYVLCCQVGF